MLQTPTDVLGFWFGQDNDDAAVVKQQSSLWWSKNPVLDAEIRQRFEPTLLAAAHGSLNAWAETSTGRLALILLTDQMPRNIYRATPQAFAFDSMALQWCKAGLAQRIDLHLRPIQRVFFYLPLEHSESLDDQRMSVKLFGELVDGVTEELRPVFAGYLDFAQRHQAIIEQFGRFPHRNSVFKRESSSEETEFLKQPGSGF